MVNRNENDAVIEAFGTIFVARFDAGKNHPSQTNSSEKGEREEIFRHLSLSLEPADTNNNRA